MPHRHAWNNTPRPFGPGLVRSRQSRATGEGSSESERAPLDGWRAATPTHAELDATDDSGGFLLSVGPCLTLPAVGPAVDRSTTARIPCRLVDGGRCVWGVERTDGKQARPNPSGLALLPFFFARTPLAPGPPLPNQPIDRLTHLHTLTNKPQRNHGGQGPRDHPLAEVHPQRPPGAPADGTCCVLRGYGVRCVCC